LSCLQWRQLALTTCTGAYMTQVVSYTVCTCVKDSKHQTEPLVCYKSSGVIRSLGSCTSWLCAITAVWLGQIMFVISIMCSSLPLTFKLLFQALLQICPTSVSSMRTYNIFKGTPCTFGVFVKQRPLEPLWCTCSVVNSRTRLQTPNPHENIQQSCLSIITQRQIRQFEKITKNDRFVAIADLFIYFLVEKQILNFWGRPIMLWNYALSEEQTHTINCRYVFLSINSPLEKYLYYSHRNELGTLATWIGNTLV